MNDEHHSFTFEPKYFCQCNSLILFFCSEFITFPKLISNYLTFIIQTKVSLEFIFSSIDHYLSKTYLELNIFNPKLTMNQ